MKKLTLLLSVLLMAVMSFAATTVTMDFTSKAGLEKLGIAYPVDATTTDGAFQTELVAGQAYTQEGVSLTATHGSTPTRIWLTAKGVLDLRHYKTGVLTFAAPAGKVILKVAMAGGNVAGFADAPSGLWTGEKSSVALTADAGAGTIKIKTIEVTYGDAGEDIGNGDNNGGDDNGGTTPPPANPEGVITCAEAVAICEATGSTATTETYTIRGYVTEIKYAWSEKYGTATFWIADTKDGGSVLQAYSCAPLTDADKVFAVGAYVELVGKLKQHNTTNEVEKGTYTVITPADGGTTPPTPPTPPTDLVGAGTADNPYTVEDVIALNNTLTGTHYVKGYIIGQVNGPSISSGLDTEAPFEGSTNSDGSVATQGTNLMIASAQGETTTIVPVALPKGELRDAFNLVENPDMLGVEVLICGELIKYFGVPGIKNPTTIEVIGGGDPNVVTITGLQYADAYYYEEEGVYEIDLYNELVIDENTGEGEYVYPDLYLALQAKSKTALNGKYDLLYAGLWTTANDSVEMGDVLGTVTIQNKDENNNYSFSGSYVGTDGKTYKFNQVVYVTAYDTDYDEIVLKEGGSDPGTGTTPEGMITCAEAATIAAAENYKGTENVTVYGYVVELGQQKVDDKSGRNKQTFWLSDENGGAKQFQAFWAYVPDFFQVGDKVAVTGILQNYKGTIEISDGEATLLGTTAVEDVTVGATPVKVIENGQVLIIRGENIYNVLGAQVK